MQSFKESLESELGPLWGAIVAAISTLYGLWPVISLYNSLVVKSNNGVGWLGFLVFGFIAFVIVIVIVVYLLGAIFLGLKNNLARIAICLALILIFWINNGVPHPFGLVMIALSAVSGYIQGRKAREDSSDREEFFNE